MNGKLYGVVEVKKHLQYFDTLAQNILLGLVICSNILKIWIYLYCLAFTVWVSYQYMQKLAWSNFQRSIESTVQTILICNILMNGIKVGTNLICGCDEAFKARPYCLYIHK